MKKLLSILLCISMLVAILSVASVSVSAGTNGITQAGAVAWANSQVGKSLDYDGAYGAQCVDLTKYYYAYLGQAAPMGNANQYVNGGAFTPAGWSYQSSPQPGDIAVWTTGSYGHVAIVTEIRSGSYVIVEQNYNYQSYCTSREIAYSRNNAAAYIRPDFAAPAPSITKPAIEVYPGKSTENTVVYITNNASAQNTDYYEIRIFNAVNNEQVAVNWGCYDTRCCFRLPVGSYFATATAIDSSEISSGNQYWMASDYSATFTVEPGNDAPKDTITYKGNVYELYLNKMTWGEARDFCAKKGGHLVTITSGEEQEAIAPLIKQSNTFVWLGLTDEQNTGKWKWVTDEPTVYTNWVANEPNNGVSNAFGITEHYAHTGGSYKYEWNDVVFNHEGIGGFICEYENKEPTQPSMTKPSAIPITKPTIKPTTEPTGTDVEPTETEPTGGDKLLGDANDDGNVNMKDVLLMRKFLAGMSVTLNEQNADCNSDGTVNMKDVLMLRKYLAGLITELG